MQTPGIKQDNIYLALLSLLKWQSATTMRGICGQQDLTRTR